MDSVAYNSKIQVFNATFNGVRDIIEHGLKGFPKEGVYVGVDTSVILALIVCLIWGGIKRQNNSSLAA